MTVLKYYVLYDLACLTYYQHLRYKSKHLYINIGNFKIYQLNILSTNKMICFKYKLAISIKYYKLYPSQLMSPTALHAIDKYI